MPKNAAPFQNFSISIEFSSSLYRRFIQFAFTKPPSRCYSMLHHPAAGRTASLAAGCMFGCRSAGRRGMTGVAHWTKLEESRTGWHEPEKRREILRRMPQMGLQERRPFRLGEGQGQLAKSRDKKRPATCLAASAAA